MLRCASVKTNKKLKGKKLQNIQTQLLKTIYNIISVLS